MTAYDIENLFYETMPSLRPVTDHTLPAYTYGSYPLIYLTASCEVLCAECATEELKLWQLGEAVDPVTAYGTHDEGPDETCADCGAQIESAYGDPWADNDSEES